MQNDDLKKLGILGIQDGQLFLRIQEAFMQMMDNINDPRMDPSKKRGINITIRGWCPDKNPKNVRIECDVDVKLVNRGVIATDFISYEKQNSKGDKIKVLQEKTDSPIGQIDINGNMNLPLEIAYDFSKNLIEYAPQEEKTEQVIIDDEIVIPEEVKVFKTI